LVKAAKANGGAKKPLPKKPITNADVKKSSGKIVVLPPDGTPAPAALSEAKGSSLALYEAKKKALAATQKRVADAEAKVAALEKDLARIEQSYYEAADPSYRDTTIAPRFDQTKKQLDAARQELADAREVLAPLTPKPQ
jgi:predicted  nucleic acid-binding Zn-ribbon protein